MLRQQWDRRSHVDTQVRFPKQNPGSDFTPRADVGRFVGVKLNGLLLGPQRITWAGPTGQRPSTSGEHGPFVVDSARFTDPALSSPIRFAPIEVSGAA